MSVFDEFKKLSITSYLMNRGLLPEQSNKSKTWFSSPFSEDNTPSFIVYEDTNSFYDWANGVGGDIITLVSQLEKCSSIEAVNILAEGKSLPIHTNYMKANNRLDKNQFKNFNYKKYISTDEIDIININKYADSRGIKDHYLKGQFFTISDKDEFVKHPSIMFVHRDEDLDICGAKFREIAPEEGSFRFSSRGRLCFYIMENITDDDPVLYLVESETSANSLWEIMKEVGISCIVCSIGGVNNVPDKLPESFNSMDCFILIDYDGDENKYLSRLSKFEMFGKGIKLPLSKGEDINSKYSSNDYDDIKNIVINETKKNRSLSS